MNSWFKERIRDRGHDGDQQRDGAAARCRLKNPNMPTPGSDAGAADTRKPEREASCSTCGSNPNGARNQVARAPTSTNSGAAQAIAHNAVHTAWPAAG